MTTHTPQAHLELELLLEHAGAFISAQADPDQVWAHCVDRITTLDVLTLALGRGLDPNSISTTDLMEPSSRFRSMGHVGAIRALYKAGRIQESDDSSILPTDLLAAVYFRAQGAIKELVRQGVSGSTPCPTGMGPCGGHTPFSWAMTRGDWPSAFALLPLGVHWGADPATSVAQAAVRLGQGCTPEEEHVFRAVCAAVHDDAPHAFPTFQPAPTLHPKPSRPTKPSSSGPGTTSPRYDVPTRKELSRCGALDDQGNLLGTAELNTLGALDMAVHAGRHRAARALIQAGVDPNHNAAHSTLFADGPASALVRACRARNACMIGLLLSSGANPLLSTPAGENPIDAFIMFKNRSKGGAKPNTNRASLRAFQQLVRATTALSAERPFAHIKLACALDSMTPRTAPVHAGVLRVLLRAGFPTRSACGAETIVGVLSAQNAGPSPIPRSFLEMAEQTMARSDRVCLQRALPSHHRPGPNPKM